MSLVAFLTRFFLVKVGGGAAMPRRFCASCMEVDDHIGSDLVVD